MLETLLADSFFKFFCAVSMVLVVAVNTVIYTCRNKASYGTQITAIAIVVAFFAQLGLIAASAINALSSGTWLSIILFGASLVSLAICIRLAKYVR